MPRYLRAFVPGATYFFTVAILERRRALLTRNIALLREVFSGTRQRRPFAIDAIVVLPDHLHCIWALPPGDCDFSSRWHAIKARFSAQVSRGEALSPRRRWKGERGIWQRRFWEHVVRDEADFERCADYIHWNPVKHGYVQAPLEWPHSSIHRYVERGIYARDWVADTRVRVLGLE